MRITVIYAEPFKVNALLCHHVKVALLEVPDVTQIAQEGVPSEPLFIFEGWPSRIPLPISANIPQAFSRPHCLSELKPPSEITQQLIHTTQPPTEPGLYWFCGKRHSDDYFHQWLIEVLTDKRYKIYQTVTYLTPDTLEGVWSNAFTPPDLYTAHESIRRQNQSTRYPYE